MPPEPPLRIVWIVPKFPLGSPDGARHATGCLLRSLVRLGAKIHLVCLVPEGEPADPRAAEKELGLASCTVVRRSASKWRPIPGPRVPFTFRTFAAARVRSEVQRKLAHLLDGPPSRREAFLLFDGLHAFAALEETDLPALSPGTLGVVYRAHNFETALWEQCARKARRPWTRWLFQRQAALVGEFERRVAREASLVASVSDEDGRRFRDAAPAARVAVVPIGMDFPPEEAVRPVAGGPGLELLFVGRLDWLPNRVGLKWFLEEVWPGLISGRPGTSLQIAGTGDGRWLEAFRGLPGVRLLGRADGLQPLYESCALAIAPLFQGSGTRVKILESARYARPVLSTALGAEGLGLSHGTSVYLAETRDAWLRLLTAVTREDCRRTGMAAFRELRARFDAEPVAAGFMRELEGMRVLA